MPHEIQLREQINERWTGWRAVHCWRNADGNVYAEYAYDNGKRWDDNYNWLDNHIDEQYCVLVGN